MVDVVERSELLPDSVASIAGLLAAHLGQRCAVISLTPLSLPAFVVREERVALPRDVPLTLTVTNKDKQVGARRGHRFELTNEPRQARPA